LGRLARAFDEMAVRLEDLYQHLEDRVDERTAQLRTLHEASQTVVSELHLDRVLQTLANLARSLIDAEYAAVLAPRTDPARSPRFLISSAPGAVNRAGLSAPRGEGLLGALLNADAPLRIDDLSRHPAAVGFPAGHPAMKSFLGAPIRVHGRTIGALYLTNKKRGAAFDQEDEQLLVMLAVYAGIAIENARLYAELTGMNEALEARVRERTAELETVSAERARYALQLRRVLNRTVRVQEAERKRIANGVHDGVSQWLMGALFELQAVRVRLPHDLPEIEKHLAEAQRMLREVKTEMRRVIYDLHPPLLDSNGLVAALRGHIAEVQTHYPVHCNFTLTGEPQRLPPDQALALFRIAQEAISNAIRHADADRIDISLTYAADHASLVITDDGCGFDPARSEEGSAPQHLGLMSMEERAIAAGASLSIRAAPNAGVQVRVQVPIDRKEPSHGWPGTQHPKSIAVDQEESV